MKKSFQQGKKYQLVFLQARSYNWRKKKEFCRRSISPTFYEQLFLIKVFCATFLYFQFGFVIFWQKNVGENAAHKKCL